MKIRLWLLLASTAFALGACARESAPPAGAYKIGEPYRIQGQWYYPAEDFKYEETGIASWYGARFHGRKTANGEIFDMHKVSAAHRTLPLPSLVEVTNLDNGRTIEVRINDRGPFARDRIIDLSRRGAELLGFKRQGTARVRVRIRGEESKVLALQSQAIGRKSVIVAGARTPRTPVQSIALAPPPAAGGTAATAARIYVQTGAFSERANADRMRRELSALGQSTVIEARIGGRILYRVRLGPAANFAAAARLRVRLAQAGYPGAQVIVE